jgi:hypothetical protein
LAPTGFKHSSLRPPDSSVNLLISACDQKASLICYLKRVFFSMEGHIFSKISLRRHFSSKISLRQKATWENLENSVCAHTWCDQVCICQTAQRLIQQRFAHLSLQRHKTQIIH